MRLDEMFDKALELWGLDAQILMLAEESSELAVASLHLRRNLKDKTTSHRNFAEEIADVELMIAQMKHAFKYLPELVAEFRKIKKAKLEELLAVGRCYPKTKSCPKTQKEVIKAQCSCPYLAFCSAMPDND